MPPDTKHAILANMNVKLKQNAYFSQGSAATDLRGDGSSVVLIQDSSADHF